MEPLKLTPTELKVSRALKNRHIIQCVANCSSFGDVFPSSIESIKLTRGLLGGLEAKGILKAELVLDLGMRHFSFSLSEQGKACISIGVDRE